MKKQMIGIALVLFSGQFLHAQEQMVKVDFPGRAIDHGRSTFNSSLFLPDTTRTQEYYLQKSKNQETAAWVMFGSGMALTVGGILGAAANALNTDNSGTTYGVVALAGLGLTLGSIPLFVSSGHNARKAATLSLERQRVLVPLQNGMVFKAQPAISLRMPL